MFVSHLVYTTMLLQTDRHTDIPIITGSHFTFERTLKISIFHRFLENGQKRVQLF